MKRLYLHPACLFTLAAILSCLAASDALAQRGGGGGSGVYKSRITPNWIDGGSRFWYRNDLPGGKREFILVDPAKGTREVVAEEPKAAAAAPTNPASASRTDATRSRTTGAESELTFINRTKAEVEIFWLDTDGGRQSYGKLAAGARKSQHTYAGHVWDVTAAGGRSLGAFIADEVSKEVVIEQNAPSSAADSRPAQVRRSAAPFAGRSRAGSDSRSPDGRWIARVQDHNVVIRATEGDREVKLSQDGSEGRSYGMLQWSPDSSTLVAYRIQPADRKEVHLVESSPKGGGRAVLHTRPYAQPGDRFTSYELRLFSVAKEAPIACRVDAVDFGTPRIRFRKDGKHFTYEKTDRGHQRIRLVEVDTETGASRNLIDERTETFIWTAHAENVGMRPFTWLENSEEIIYASERDGWRHLYLVDANEGAIRNQITKGEYVVRGVERIDEAKRQIWFRASGKSADQDPYFIHYYRVNFDGTDLVQLTAGNGNHTVQFSPDHAHLIDTYSRVEQPPVHELRRSSDGSLVCELEQADISGLQATGWEAPEVFTAKGRDGTTDIWGIICRPRNFDPAKKYPVIESIYAGPHGSFVPKSFSPQRRFSTLTDLGFVVVQMDGMGTANRSKAFHDVCWKNIKDAGFPDRILWHKAVAAKYSWYDSSRVGIYGTSAGGQNSTGAMLFHPDFYKVAVSACGCHDNRLDKASWNEQWMGFPVGPQYAESSNIDNAWRLKGKLLLIVGEMDTNVPPESTYRLVDALIKASKDFDLLMVPGAGHGMGGAYGSRRMHDFFVRNLLGEEPPNRNSGAGSQ